MKAAIVDATTNAILSLHETSHAAYKAYARTPEPRLVCALAVVLDNACVGDVIDRNNDFWVDMSPAAVQLIEMVDQLGIDF